MTLKYPINIYLSTSISCPSRHWLWFSSVQLSSVTQSCPTCCSSTVCSTPFSLSITNSRSLLKLMSTEWMTPSNHLILCSPLLFLPSIFQVSGSFQISQPFTSGGQSIGASASASILPMNIQDWFPLGLSGLIFFQSKRLSRVFSSTTIWKHQFFSTLPSLWSNFHIYTWLLKKKIALTTQTFVGKVISLLFNMLPRLVIAFLPRSKCLLISWLQSPSAVILDPPK